MSEEMLTKPNYDPLPKVKRHADPAVLDRARKRRRCEKCGKRVKQCDPHHIDTRGAGNPDTDDNVVSLCRWCHDSAHAGRISKRELRAIIEVRNERGGNVWAEDEQTGNLKGSGVRLLTHHTCPKCGHRYVEETRA